MKSNKIIHKLTPFLDQDGVLRVFGRIDYADCIGRETKEPNHFLDGGPNAVQIPAVRERIIVRKQWHILQQLKQRFWKRGLLDYLPDLTRRTKWYKPVRPLRVDDVVIICDDYNHEENGRRALLIWF